MDRIEFDTVDSFVDVREYIKQSREERRRHLQLSRPCIEIGGLNSQEFRGLLAYYLKTTIPFRCKILLCHACNNSRCSNPQHLYWGTPSDNFEDMKLAGTFKSWYQKVLEKYGPDFYKNKLTNGENGGKFGGGRNRLTQEELDRYRQFFQNMDIRSFGWVTSAARQLGLSHTQVRRIVDRLGLESYKRQQRV